MARCPWKFQFIHTQRLLWFLRWVQYLPYIVFYILSEYHSRGARQLLWYTDIRYDRPGRFARARPRAGPRGAANLGTSSLVPGNGRFRNFSTGVAMGDSPTEFPTEKFLKARRT